MRYSSIIASMPRLLNARDAEDYVCGPTMLRELIEKWGLRVFDRRNGLTAYDRHDIDAAIDRKKAAAEQEGTKQ